MASLSGIPDFTPIPEAIEAYGTSGTNRVFPCGRVRLTINSTARGDFLVVLDSPHREDEGDLIIAASAITPAKAAFLIRHTSGYLCVPLTALRATELGLPQMVSRNEDPKGTAYSITVDAIAPDLTTGISAADRALTCRWLADPSKGKNDFRRPGHVAPLQAREGGVRERPGHTEAAVDLCRLAGLEGVGAIAELVEEGQLIEGSGELAGTIGMMRRDGCLRFAKRWGLCCVTIEELVAYIEMGGKGLEGKQALNQLDGLSHC
jgi:3,4-dihydroxy 2-butanone 4-phosphate synthase